MCGRYVSPEQAEIERFWHIERRNNPFGRNFNVAPTSPVPLLRQAKTGELELAIARWGLILLVEEIQAPRLYVQLKAVAAKSDYSVDKQWLDDGRVGESCTRAWPCAAKA